MGTCGRCYQSLKREIHSGKLVFLTQLCDLLPLWSSLWSLSPPLSLPCLNKYMTCTYRVGIRQINTCRKAPL